jgi:hypothetical protein
MQQRAGEEENKQRGCAKREATEERNKTREEWDWLLLLIGTFSFFLLVLMDGGFPLPVTNNLM